MSWEHSYTWTNYVLLIGFTQPNVKNHRDRKFGCGARCCVHQPHLIPVVTILLSLSLLQTITIQIASVAKTNYQTPFNTQQWHFRIYSLQNQPFHWGEWMYSFPNFADTNFANICNSFWCEVTEIVRIGNFYLIAATRQNRGEKTSDGNVPLKL